MIKKLIILGIVLSSLIACETKDGYIDTGRSIRHNCSIYEYLKTSSYNWDSVRLMIQTAGMTELFDGKDVQHPEITFFGITNHSIRRYMLEKDIKRVVDIPAATCRRILLKHLLDKRVMKKEIAFRIPNQAELQGGTPVTCMGGNELILYLEQDDYAGVENAGAIHMYIRSITSACMVPLGSPNISLTNGVVHALNYNYDLGKI